MMICDLLGHAAMTAHYRNQGLDFAFCVRCGGDLVRRDVATGDPCPAPHAWCGAAVRAAATRPRSPAESASRRGVTGPSARRPSQHWKWSRPNIRRRSGCAVGWS
jgi:hypothetical protein